MSRPITGKDANGSGTVYTLSNTEAFRLDTLTFTLTTDGTAVVRSPEVLLRTPNGALIARVVDLSDAAASGTYTYTFGIGLIPSNCVLVDGGAARDDLPVTDLEPQGSVFIQSVDTAGAIVTGDEIRDVVLYVTDTTTAGDTLTGDIPPYTSQAFDIQSFDLEAA